VNTRPAIKIAAAALPIMGRRLDIDARGTGGSLAFGVARGAGGEALAFGVARASRGVAGTRALAAGAAAGIGIGGGGGGAAATICVGAAVSTGCASTRDAAVWGGVTSASVFAGSPGGGVAAARSASAAASSGVILMRTVSAVVLTAVGAGLGGADFCCANDPSTR